MKKALAICILCLVLLSCAYAEVLTVGTDLSAEEIRDFYYTYDWVGYNAEYHRYRFFTENGKFFLQGLIIIPIFALKIKNQK